MTRHLLGFFDSGLGGLTVLRRVLERHGPVPSLYLGDTARVPYGNRQPDDIRRIADLGYSGIIMRYIGRDAEEQRIQIDRFANDVMAKV